MWRRVGLLLIGLMLAACQSGGGGASSSPPPTRASASPVSVAALHEWPAGQTIAVYDGMDLDGRGHTVNVVQVSGSTATVLAKAVLGRRTPRPGPACGLTPCGSAIEPQYVSTTSDAVFALEGDATVKEVLHDGSLRTITSVPGSRTSVAAFAVSPDDSMIAVGVIDYQVAGLSRVYIERLGGGGHVDVLTSGNPVYWPVGWHDGNIVLGSSPAYGGTMLNPYDAQGYALVSPTARATPKPLGAGDCVPSGTLVAAGSACLMGRGTQCLEGVVDNPEPTPYYNSCLRRLDWTGAETVFLLPANAYTSSFTVAYAALSADGQQIVTDQLGTVFAPVSATHGGNEFLGSYRVAVPASPSMGWIDAQRYSFSFVYPDGSTRARIAGATFDSMPDVAPGLPDSPVQGQLIGMVPAGL